MKRCPLCNRTETDDALVFCRVDGTALVSDSSPLRSEAGTAQLDSKSAATEIDTSILPHTTNAVMSRGTAPTTLLPAQKPPSMTRELTKPKRRAVLIALASLIVVAVAVAGYFYLTRKDDTAIQSIAVMPFVNASGNADLEYLSDGMTETLMGSLSQIPNLHVKARSLVFRYKGKEANPQTIGQELNVQAILNGRVAKRGTELILYLELVDARTGNLIWSDQYNRKEADLVSLQSDIARDVSTKLKTKLSGTDEQKLTKNATQNPEAYKLYLQGRFYANKRTPKDALKSIEYFQQAVNADPNYALGYAGLALSYAYLTVYGSTPGKETFPKVRQFAEKSMELDNTLAEPHLMLGLVLFLQDHDLAGWERETKRALELNPNSTDAHRLNGFRLMCLGRFEEALAEIRRALEIEPLSMAGNINYSYALFYANRLEESEAQTKKSVDLFPDFWMGHYYLFNIYRFKGNYSAAVDELTKSKELRGEADGARAIRDSFAKGGWQGFLRDVVTEHERMKLSPYDQAGFYAELRNKDQAFAALNQSIEAGDQLVGFVKIDPFLQPLRDDPRFVDLVKRIGLPQ